MALTKVGKEGITGISNASDATAITITSGENVGIGETASANLLHVKASDTGIAPHASAQIVLEREGTNYLQFLTAENGTSGCLFGDGSDVDVGKIAYDHNVPAMQFQVEAGEMMRITGSFVGIGVTNPSTHKLQVAGDFSGTSAGTALFQNTHTSVGTNDEVVRIQFSGDNDATGGHFVNFFDSGGDIGRINVASSSTVAYATSSDYRLKENVSYTWDATTRLKQLKPCRFNFIADSSNTLQDGFLAHEAQSVVPVAVGGTKDEVHLNSDGSNKLDDDGNTIPKHQDIDHSLLVPLLVKTIQELEARLTAGGL